MLRAENLVKRYHRRAVVDGVSLELETGEVVGLLGPNGAGKTTCFFLIVGAIALEGGRIFIGEEEITQQPMYVRAQKGVGYLSQEPSIFRKLTVLQNLLAVLETLKMSKASRMEKAFSLLEDLGLSDLAHQRAESLSGGEARRLEISRALARTPRFLLLDEPFAGVDPRAVEDIQGIIEDLKRRDIGLLITDHNVRDTLAITDRSYILSEGQILLSGTSRELAENPEARRIYLGERFRLDS
ncbi:MAG: LPS export ABC transporter ATP-binding protein [bacterium]|nr:LPS export ABC transporter ATP-binding protein [bacterium]